MAKKKKFVIRNIFSRKKWRFWKISKKNVFSKTTQMFFYFLRFCFPEIIFFLFIEGFSEFNEISFKGKNIDFGKYLKKNLKKDAN